MSSETKSRGGQDQGNDGSGQEQLAGFIPAALDVDCGDKPDAVASECESGSKQHDTNDAKRTNHALDLPANSSRQPNLGLAKLRMGRARRKAASLEILDDHVRGRLGGERRPAAEAGGVAEEVPEDVGAHP